MITGDFQERPRTTNHSHPPQPKGSLYPFHLPKVIEYLHIIDHRFRINDSVDRCIDAVFKREDVPSNLAVLESA